MIIDKDFLSLHENLLYFLLSYRSNTKYANSPNFLFRPLEDLAALNEGRWFYDNPEKGWVDLYFSKGLNSREYGKNMWVHNNNIQFGIHVSGNWNISFDLPNVSTGFYHQLVQEFGRIGYFVDWNYTRQRNTLTPKKNRNYKLGLPDALDTFFQFTKQESNSKLPFALISNEDFEASLQTINAYRKKDNVTQVFLSGLEIKNYQGIKETTIDKLPQQASWIFLTGENSFGKTSFLKALAIGLYGDAEDVIIPRYRGPEIKTQFTYRHISGKEIEVSNDINNLLFFRSLPALAAYGPSRLELQAQDSHDLQAKNSTATYNLFNTDGVLKNIEAELLISFYDAKEKYEVLTKMLTQIIPFLSKVELDKDNRKILYYEQQTNNDSKEHFGAIGFSELASGIKSIVAIVGDIYLRLTEAQNKAHSLQDKTLPIEKVNKVRQNYSPEKLFGIVIIDELDLHLHPKWQRVLPSILSEVFPNVQFIASTHSPIPLLGAPKNSVFLKVNRTVSQGITVQRLSELENEISNLLPNAILESTKKSTLEFLS